MKSAGLLSRGPMILPAPKPERFWPILSVCQGRSRWRGAFGSPDTLPRLGCSSNIRGR